MPVGGDSIGPYRIVRPLGQGATGAVYEAEDPALGRRVAIKVLLPEVVGEAEDLARFEREAKLAASLAHPNVVGIYGIGRTPDGMPYLAMELAEGRNLFREIEARRAVSISTALDWTRQIARGLAAAHDVGIVHRDMKLSNVLVTTAGLKVVDFGLAKRIGGDKLTQTGTMLGTPKYMAPECIMTPENVDARADVWAVGVIFHRLLTGTMPFDPEDGDVLLAILKTRYAPPSDLPTPIQTVLAKCLDPDPSRRYPNARALLDALGAVRIEKPRPPIERRRSVFIPAVVLTLITLPVLGYVALRFSIRDRSHTLANPRPPLVVVAPPEPSALPPEPESAPTPTPVVVPKPKPPRVVYSEGYGSDNVLPAQANAQRDAIVMCLRSSSCEPGTRTAVFRQSAGTFTVGGCDDRKFSSCFAAWASSHPMVCQDQTHPCWIEVSVR